MDKLKMSYMHRFVFAISMACVAFAAGGETYKMSGQD
jgi:hypothetical protein